MQTGIELVVARSISNDSSHYATSAYKSHSSNCMMKEKNKLWKKELLKKYRHAIYKILLVLVINSPRRVDMQLKSINFLYSSVHCI